MGRTLQCPRCKSKDINCMITNEVNVSSTGGGYGAGKGCLGFLLLGPLGLLCGACGSKQKISTQNKQSTLWVCKSCGEKFRDLEEIDAEISAVAAISPGRVWGTAFFGFITLWILFKTVLNVPYGFFSALIFCVIVATPTYLALKKDQEEKLSVLYKERSRISRSAYSEE